MESINALELDVAAHTRHKNLQPYSSRTKRHDQGTEAFPEASTPLAFERQHSKDSDGKLPSVFRDPAKHLSQVVQNLESNYASASIQAGRCGEAGVCFAVATGWSSVQALQGVAPNGAHQTDALSVDVAQDEFFPVPLIPLCAASAPCWVLGSFDSSIFPSLVATAQAVGDGCVDCIEDIQPDGTFSLLVPAEKQFELRTSQSDGKPSLVFGPFQSGPPNTVMYLSALGQSADRSHLRSIEIALPRLEVPPHGLWHRPQSSKQPEATGKGESCTCFEEHSDTEDDADPDSCAHKD